MPPSSQTSQQTQHVVTPWRHHSDLLAVRTNLYTPSTPTDQAHAIATVAAWKLRGNVPHAVESTALLFDAMLFHARTTGSLFFPSSSPSTQTPFSSPPTQLDASSFALRAAYTTALSRFVTGFADLGRHRGGVGQSMFDVARTIALPAHFVELRHEVAHEEMPGLARLVRSAREAVQWLWGVYWGRLRDDVVTSDQGEESRVDGAGVGDMGIEVGQVAERAKSLLGGFRSQRVASLKAKKGKKEGKLQAQVTYEQCAELCRGQDAREKWEVVASVLIDDGLIIPSLKQRGPLPDSALQGAYLLWDELLLHLARRSDSFVESFLERAVGHITESAADEDDDRSNPIKWAMYRWILHILFSDDWSELKTQAESAWEGCVLRECSLYPNDHWARDLAEKVSSEANDDVRTLIGQGADVDQDVDDLADGAPDVVVSSADTTTSVINVGGWRQDDGPWKPLPLGVVQS